VHASPDHCLASKGLQNITRCRTFVPGAWGRYFGTAVRPPPSDPPDEPPLEPLLPLLELPPPPDELLEAPLLASPPV
jgi:hypothetical protein